MADPGQRAASSLRISCSACRSGSVTTSVGVDLVRAGRPLPEIESLKRLIVVPDLPMIELPFEALVADCERYASTGVPGPPTEPVHELYRQCRYLGLERSVSYLPSAGTLAALDQRRRQSLPDPAPASLLALAPWAGPSWSTAAAKAQRHAGGGTSSPPPLPQTRREVRSVGEMFHQRAVFRGLDASEATFKARASEHGVLHLATHGLVDDSVPMASGILLAPGEGDDGLLQGHEVQRLRLRLRSDLVTLSACRSGRGSPSRGEGMLGLSRAFLEAGSSAVLVSLWDVGDETSADLMLEFYRHLSAGAGPAEALRMARVERFNQAGRERLALRHRAVSYAHPSYWATFRLVGLP